MRDGRAVQSLLPAGLYDRLVAEQESAELEALATQQRALIKPATAAQSRNHLIDELTARLPELLDAVASANQDKTAAAQAELQLIAHLLREARQQTSQAPIPTPAFPLRILQALHQPDQAPQLPETGLRRPWIFTSARSDPSLLNELHAELACVDSVDILVSFITWSGVRKLLDVLKAATAVNAHGVPATRLRILTTTYIGATEVRAVDALASLPGVEVRISLDGRRNRLHAKAWLFHRQTGFGSAFVGSANLSESALIGGIEWTVKFSQARDADMYQAASANFETLWHDGEFQSYDPTDASQRSALTSALEEQRRAPGKQMRTEPIALHTWFELRPKAYQSEMLDRLEAERRMGRRRNLVVAATGTGKTVVAAFDYLRLTQQAGSPPRLLFVAHRTQILEQALATFRQVLRDPGFGELLDGEHTPQQFGHLFATIATLHRRDFARTLGSDYWHMVIVDEAHHLPAKSFDQLLQTVQPHLLLGLTATPERSDGQSLNKYFDARPDGTPAVSLRLWDALDQQLLAPFEYYATADDTDLTSVKWNRPEETGQLDALISSNVVRGRLVIEALQRYVADLANLKAIVFCVSVRHADMMADWLTRAGLPSVSLTGVSTQDQRTQAIRALRQGEIKLICTCDLFNEGVDIPEINTLLLLRPTQSPVIFQQQIGRGLRLADGKESCLVLDFVGQCSEEFRYDRLLRSITGQTRAQLKNSLEHGFGHLPSGCHIQFDRVARERVLTGLRKALDLNARRLRQELAIWLSNRGEQPIRLKDFLIENEIALHELYTGKRGWTSYQRELNLPVAAMGPRELELQSRIGAVLHTNDPNLLAAWANLLRGGAIDARRVQMLAYQMLFSNKDVMDANAFYALLQQHPALLTELQEVIAWQAEQTTLAAIHLPDAPAAWPLTLHGRYERREIQTAVGHLNASKRPEFREGCLPLNEEKIECLFVTLDKREGFGDRVQYHDYAISPTRFHWQSQNKASIGNDTGLRYLQSPDNGWRFQLFVREDPAHAFVALGPVTLISHEGDRPISIVWQLAVAMPAEVFRRFSVLRSA